MSQQFVVPQFIDVEDKILGPITVRQFSILMVAALALFIMYRLLSFLYFVLGGLPVLGGSVALAFVKINGMPLHFFLLNFIQTSKRANIRVWNKELTDAEIIALSKVEPPPEKPKPIYKEAPSTSRLSDLALVVNTGGVYHPEE